MDLFESLKNKISGKNIKIVFPEGNDERIVKAAVRLANDGMIKPIILGSKETVEDSNNGQALPESIEVIDPDKYPSEEFEKMVAAFVERRKGKNTEEQARKMLKDVNYFGTMMVYMGNADGLVSGAIHPTGDTVRPALQIIKTKPGVSRTSGAFIMSRGDERYYFADCAININPNAEALAEIAVQSAKSARLFDIDPRVALLSFSTMGSAKSDEVTKVQEATKLAKEMAPDEQIDGELQFDAAFVKSVAEKKAKDSKVAGSANAGGLRSCSFPYQMQSLPKKSLKNLPKRSMPVTSFCSTVILEPERQRLQRGWRADSALGKTSKVRLSH